MGKPTVEMADKMFSSMDMIAPFFLFSCFIVQVYVSNHENTLSLLAQPRASKFLLRLRSHSLRSEAALKDFRWFADIPAYRVINRKA